MSAASQLYWFLFCIRLFSHVLLRNFEWMLPILFCLKKRTFDFKYDQYGHVLPYLLEQRYIVIKSSSMNNPMRYADKKHVENENKKYPVTFSCRYVSKLESNKLSLLQIILLKWDWYIHVIFLLQCHVPCSRYLFLLNYKSILINHKYAIKIAFK